MLLFLKFSQGRSNFFSENLPVITVAGNAYRLYVSILDRHLRWWHMIYTGRLNEPWLHYMSNVHMTTLLQQSAGPSTEQGFLCKIVYK